MIFGVLILSFSTLGNKLMCQLRSSKKFECWALADITAELMWLTTLLSELKVPVSSKLIIWCDNLSTISLIANTVQHARTKHIELDFNFMR